MRSFKDSSRLILDEVRDALDRVDPTSVESLVEAIMLAEKVFFIGVGRVMLSLKAFCKRLNHLGISAHCVGDTNEPAITESDLLIVGSGSGESIVPVGIAKVATEFNPRIAHIGSNMESSLKPMTDLFVRIPTKTKLELPDEISSEQAMTSLFEQCLLIFGDAVAEMILSEKNLAKETLWKFHANLE